MENVKLTGLWKNKTPKGVEYLAGSLGSARISIFPNSYKDAENHPDFIVYLSKQEKREDKAADIKSMPPKNTQDVFEKTPQDVDIDDIPF